MDLKSKKNEFGNLPSKTPKFKFEIKIFKAKFDENILSNCHKPWSQR